MGVLFFDRNDKEYDAETVLKALREIGAHDCDALFIHSDIMFGRMPAGFRRNDYLASLTEILESLGPKLIVPTFTYSFCNGEDYNVSTSKTSMGALNEFIRKRKGRYRTLDPLLSLSVPEEMKSRFACISEHSLGEGSGLDVLHHTDGVKFLFFGARLGNCFTYVHYVEKMLDVRYRFDMPFEGNITDENTNTFHQRQYMHTACKGVKPAEYYYFEDEMENRGLLKKIPLADSTISCISEKDAYREIAGKINSDINYFLQTPFTEDDLVHEYTKGLNGIRITHC